DGRSVRTCCGRARSTGTDDSGYALQVIAANCAIPARPRQARAGGQRIIHRAPPGKERAMTSLRLSPLDASFLTVESPTAHMHVGFAAAFEPPEDGPAPTYGQLLEHIGARLGRAPRYRQRLCPVPLGVNAPVWADDPGFRLAHHVRPAGPGRL